MRLEKELKEFTGHTLLHCCILLSKVDNIPDSLKYAKESREVFEKDLGIDQGKEVPNFESAGETLEERDEIQNKLEKYAMTLHMIAKDLKSLDKIDEGNTFLKRALKIAEESLIVKRPKLIEEITKDMEQFQTDIRSLPNRRIIEDPEKLLDKLTNKLLNQKKPIRSTLSSRSQRDTSKISSENRMGSISSDRKDVPMTTKPPLASKRSLQSKLSKGNKNSKVVKAADDSEQLHISINERKKKSNKKKPEPVKNTRKARPVRIPSLQNQSALMKNEDESNLNEDKERKFSQSMVEPSKDRCKKIFNIQIAQFIKKPRFNLAKEGAMRDKQSESDEKHGNDEEIDEKYEQDSGKKDKNKSIQRVYEKYGNFIT